MDTPQTSSINTQVSQSSSVAPVTPTIPNPNPVPPVNKPKKKFSLFIGVIVLLLVLIGGVAFAFSYIQKPAIAPEVMVSPLPVETPTDNSVVMGGKLYTNTKLGFRLTHPDNWKVCETPGVRLSFIDLDQACAPPYVPYNLQVTEIANTQVVEDYVAPGDSANYVKSGKQSVKIGKNQFIKQSFKPISDTFDTVYFYDLIDPVNNRVIEFYAIGKDVQEEVLEKTLSTFEFTDTNEVMVPGDSQTTYTNTAYSYSVSFPSSWKAYDQASGPGVSVATPRSDIVDVIDKTQSASIPYPSGVIVFQHHSEIPELYTSWTRSDTSINGIHTRIYENTNEASVVYIFTAPEMASFMEVRFNASKEVPAYKTFESIISTFKFNL